MLNLVDVHVVFADFESEHILGKWYVDDKQKVGTGSQQGLTDWLVKKYERQGKKVMYLSIWPSERLAA